MPDNAPIDENSTRGLIAASSVDGSTPVKLYANPTTHRLLVTAGSGGFVNTEVPTGTVDGSNVTFTFTTAPVVIVVDQGRVMKNGSGWSLVGLVATLDVAPTFEIFSIY